MKTLRLLLLFCPILAFSQTWPLLQAVDGDNFESVDALLPLSSGGTVVAGTYFGSSPFPGGSGSSGKADLFIARYDASANLEWYLEGGDQENETVSGLAELPNGDIALAGSYWFNLPLGDTILETGSSVRSLFLARLTAEGTVAWSKRLSGDGLKDIADVDVLPDSSVVIAGFFRNTLELGDSTLTTTAAPGSTSLFVAAFAPNGTLRWVTQAGGEDDLRITAMAVGPDGQIGVGGKFNGVSELAGTPLDAGFFNQDVFLAAFSPAGTPLWARDLGGVIDDNLQDLAIDTSGNLYATGNLIGVMNLSPEISIESSNGNDDCFLVKYSADGTPLWGRALGGPDVQDGLSIAVQRDFVVMGGGFQGAIGWDGLSADVGENGIIWGLIAAFTPEGDARWLRTLPTNDFGLIECLAFSNEQQLYAGGSFGNTGAFNGETLPSNGPNSGFWGRLSDLLSPTLPEPSAIATPVTAFPNPTTGRLQLANVPNGATVTVINAMGQQVRETAFAEAPIDLSLLPEGWYAIRVQEKRGVVSTIKVLKQ
jgi:hypothetical protein